jgi:hypothetical protein
VYAENEIGFAICIGLEALVVCLTGLLALRQGRKTSHVRLGYEIASVVVVLASILQYLEDSGAFAHGFGMALLAFFPVPYWVMVWDEAIYARLKQSSGCLALVIALVFFGLFAEIPASRMRSPHNQVLIFLLVLILYLPPLLGLAARLNAIRNRPQGGQAGPNKPASHSQETGAAQDTRESKLD